MTLTAPSPQSNNRWLGLLGIIGLKQLALIPHMLALYGLMLFFGALTWLNFWVVLFAGHPCAGVAPIQRSAIQWMARVQAWFAGLADAYPPLSFDPGAHIVVTHFEGAPGNNRLLALLGILLPLKAILLIPHFVVMFFLTIWYGIVTWINFWIILFSGSGAKSVQRYQHGFIQWMIRVHSWFCGLTDAYPPFSFS